MSRPPLEMADIVRYAGQAFVERSRRWINGQHQKVLLAITRCRTAALGGHRDRCSDCGHTAISYNSCRNRHCPDARPTRACAGSSSANTSCCPPAMSTPCSRCRVNSLRSRCRTSASSTACCFKPVPQRCLSRPRSSSPGRGDRLLQRAPYLEPAIAASSSCPLRRRRWRSRFGPHKLDLFTPLLLPAGQGTQPCLPRQVRRRTEDRPSTRAA